ncbi:MAG: hypothetical protein GX558_04065 [Clostridiales bacterium]|nr:hypothetical protein [Clostridiales bacterium]
MSTKHNDFGLMRHCCGHSRPRPEFIPVTGCTRDCTGPNCTTAACNACGCGCTHCPPPAVGDLNLCDCLQIYALLAQNGELRVNADQPIPFDSVATSSDFMERNGGLVRVLVAGIYLITYSITIPCGYKVNTRFVLRRNGTAVVGTTLHVVSGCCDRDDDDDDDDSSRRHHHKRGEDSLNYFGQTVLNLSSRDHISVTSNEQLDIEADQEGDTLATLSLVRLT